MSSYVCVRGLGPLCLLLGVVWGSPAPVQAAEPTEESKYYRIEPIEIPKEAFLEVGGLAFTPDGTLYVSTRRGEIWTMKRGKNAPAQWSLFAKGLHEALGLHSLGNGDLLVAHRPELTRVRDTNHDGTADSYEKVADGWGVTGNYHEYHFGPVRDRKGNLYGTLNLGWDGRGVATTPYRGWMYQVTPKGEFVPFANGFRSPSGIGLSPQGELFVTDNQGDWLATSTLYHVQKGEFFGHPASLKWEKGYDGPPDPVDIPPETLAKRRKLPAVWFPYGIAGHAPAEPVWDTTKGKFGPFAGHMIVGDQTKSFLNRVVLEKVGGQYQGVVFPFRKGLGSGILRMVFDSDNSLIVGGTDRGWGATGGKIYALERLIYTGQVPFEIHTMSVTKDGFDLTFTRPVDKAAAADPKAYSFQHWGYKYWRTYGSPHVDPGSAEVTSAKVSADGRRVQLLVPGLQALRVWELKLRAVKAADGSAPLHDTAWYTLNRLRGN